MQRDLFLWILAGLVIGTLAKIAFSGRNAGDFVPSLLLGIAGALCGGFLLAALTRSPSIGASLLAAIAGAVLALLLYRIVIRARGR